MRKRYHWLAKVINTNKFTVGAEVGAATGITTEYLLKNCPALMKLFVVDMWYVIPGTKQWNRRDMEKIFRRKFENDKRVEIIKKVSWEGAENILQGALDFCFIDAGHDEFSVTKDIYAYKSKVKETGMLCGHDYNLPGVRVALRKAFGNKVQLAGVDNCWFVKGKDL